VNGLVQNLNSVKKTVHDTITNASIFKAEQCCSNAKLETASQSAPCEPCTSEASTAADLHCLLPIRPLQ